VNKFLFPIKLNIYVYILLAKKGLMKELIRKQNEKKIREKEIN
jgi:hypothetical protein